MNKVQKYGCHMKRFMVYVEMRGIKFPTNEAIKYSACSLMCVRGTVAFPPHGFLGDKAQNSNFVRTFT